MIRRLFDKLNIIIKVSFLHSLLIAKRGGCGLIELAQCLRRGVAEQDMPFVCTASAVWRILYERWNFVFSRMWRDGLRVVPWTTKGEARVTLLRFVGRTIFLNRKFGKKKFPIRSKIKDSKTNSSWDISEENAEFFFQSGSSRWQISLKERVVKKEWKIERVTRKGNRIWRGFSLKRRQWALNEFTLRPRMNFVLACHECSHNGLKWYDRSRHSSKFYKWHVHEYSRETSRDSPPIARKIIRLP